jgi:predicted permease
VSDGLKASSRQIAGGRGRLRFALMLTQAALSVMLLVGAGLFVKSLRAVVAKDVGIDRDRVLRVTMPLSRFGFDANQVEATFRNGADRIRAIPGVASVAVARQTYPMGGASSVGFEVPDLTKKPKFDLGGPYNAVVTPGFFATIGARVVSGRDFTETEGASPARVVIVNDVLAKGFWPNGNALGQCVRIGDDTGCSRIVGVVSTVMQFAIINDERAIVYAPPLHPGNGGVAPGAILVRVSGDPVTVTAAVQRELQALSPTMPFVNVKTFEQLVAPQLQPWRLGAMMFTLFGAIALVIAAVGLYSVMAYWVSQRGHEIGVRMALGARRADVVRLVAFESSRPVIAGLILGGTIAFLSARWISEMLYDTSARDPLVYAGAAVVLGLAAVVASVVPVRRSTEVDPAQAIRSD